MTKVVPCCDGKPVTPTTAPPPPPPATSSDSLRTQCAVKHVSASSTLCMYLVVQVSITWASSVVQYIPWSYIHAPRLTRGCVLCLLVFTSSPSLSYFGLPPPIPSNSHQPPCPCVPNGLSPIFLYPCMHMSMPCMPRTCRNDNILRLISARPVRALSGSQSAHCEWM